MGKIIPDILPAKAKLVAQYMRGQFIADQLTGRYTPGKASIDFNHKSDNTSKILLKAKA